MPRPFCCKALCRGAANFCKFYKLLQVLQHLFYFISHVRAEPDGLTTDRFEWTTEARFGRKSAPTDHRCCSGTLSSDEQVRVTHQRSSRVAGRRKAPCSAAVCRRPLGSACRTTVARRRSPSVACSRRELRLSVSATSQTVPASNSISSTSTTHRRSPSNGGIAGYPICCSN